MGKSIKSKFCRVCERQTAFVKEGPNHVLHLLLSVVTFGIWLIVWFLLGLMSGARSYRCSQCGSTG